jgi:hypothetical protein
MRKTTMEKFVLALTSTALLITSAVASTRYSVSPKNQEYVDESYAPTHQYRGALPRINPDVMNGKHFNQECGRYMDDWEENRINEKNGSRC